jgi:hypothetical protein
LSLSGPEDMDYEQVGSRVLWFRHQACDRF